MVSENYLRTNPMLVFAWWAHFPNSYDSGTQLSCYNLLLFNAIHLFMKQTKIH